MTTGICHAQDGADTAIVKSIRGAMRTMTLDVDSAELSGPGADWLIERAAESQFVLIGESHGNRETPALTRALLTRLKPHGYNTLALENGPIATDLLIDVMTKNGVAGGVELMQAIPFAIAFCNWHEEIELIDAALRDDHAVWGLDQEFLAAPRLLLSRLLELAPNDAAKQTVQQHLERAWNGFKHFAQTGDDSKSYMASSTAADFDELARIAQVAGPDAQRLVDELRASAMIYGHYIEGRYYRNNHDRVRLMKRHLVERLEARRKTDGCLPRVVYKFGSGHMARGYSPFDQLDLGNQAAELAFAEGRDSMHLYVFARGSVNAKGESRSYREQAPYLALLYDEMPADSAVIVDLLPLRETLSQTHPDQIDPELKSLALRFDAILLMPTFTAATEIVPMPGR